MAGEHCVGVPVGTETVPYMPVQKLETTDVSVSAVMSAREWDATAAAAAASAAAPTRWKAQRRSLAITAQRSNARSRVT